MIHFSPLKVLKVYALVHLVCQTIFPYNQMERLVDQNGKSILSIKPKPKLWFGRNDKNVLAGSTVQLIQELVILVATKSLLLGQDH